MNDHSALPHVVPLEGGSNFRDLGGYATTDGRRVRRGLVFRSAHLGGLTDADRTMLRALAVRTIVDFRGVPEAAETPHAIDGVGATVVPAAIPAGVGERIREAMADGSASPARVAGFMVEHYRTYPGRAAPAFRTLFATLGDGERRPLVFHCTAGKDRTGFAAALLLTLLGVPRETVIADYLRTNALWTGHVGFFTDFDPALRAAIVEARPDYIEAAFAALVAEHGDVETFADRALGFDAAAREGLREALLEG